MGLYGPYSDTGNDVLARMVTSLSLLIEDVLAGATPATGSVTDAKVAADAAIAQSKIAGLVADLAARATDAELTAGLAAKQDTIPPGTYVGDAELAALLDPLIVGAITRDVNGAATSAAVVWPNGDPGTYTATTVSTAFPGAVDAYTVTKGDPVTATFTQPLVTRNANGAVTNRPAIVVS